MEKIGKLPLRLIESILPYLNIFCADGCVFRFGLISATQYNLDSIYNPRTLTVENYFSGHPDSRVIFEAVRSVIEPLGQVDIKVSKSQIAFHTRKNIAVTWMPALYLKGNTAPLVLTLVFHTPDPSPRWKEIIRTSPNRYTHHLELRTIQDVDDQVRNWLIRSYAESRI